VHLALGWMCIYCLVACDQSEVEPDTTYTFVKPANFPDPTYTFDKNPVTKEGFELGKKLFFDPVLSKDGSVSCNNCHIQSTAFADAQQHPLSVGIESKLGIRNAPSIANMAFFPDFFWDGGVNHLDFVPINAIESEFEMGEALSNVVEKLNNHSDYPDLFKEAFDIDKVTSPFMLQALSQFMVMMVSADSKYDKYIRGEGTQLSEEELAGLELFDAKCSDCHSGELFTDFSFRNNGISSEFVDEGRGLITESADDIGKFRVPSLRNVGRTAPYMHNAKFKTLREVLDHYDEGVVISSTLDPGLNQGIPLEEDEKDKIIAFLQTLTDYEFRSDKRFSNQ